MPKMICREAINKVEHKIKIIKFANLVMRRSRRRDAAYKFLHTVYVIYLEWRAQKVAKRLSRIAVELCGIKERRRYHPIRRLIEVGRSRDAKTKSRWTKALEYAAGSSITPHQLIGFFKENDGISGCARLAAADNPRRSKDEWGE